MFAIGGVAEVAEVRMLAYLRHSPIIIEDYVFSTTIYACGAFLFFFSLPNNQVTKTLSGPGNFVLGAYGIHLWITGWPMSSHNSITSAAWSVAGVWGMSLVISQLCSLIPLLRFAFR
jgi:surface polysaccharide O-acyltransferase-like enzyme